MRHVLITASYVKPQIKYKPQPSNRQTSGYYTLCQVDPWKVKTMSCSRCFIAIAV